MRFTETVTMIMMLTMMSTTMMVMTTMPHVSRYPQVEAEVPLLRRALQLLTIFGATGSQKTSKKYHLIFVTKKSYYLWRDMVLKKFQKSPFHWSLTKITASSIFCAGLLRFSNLFKMFNIWALSLLREEKLFWSACLLISSLTNVLICKYPVTSCVELH